MTDAWDGRPERSERTAPHWFATPAGANVLVWWYAEPDYGPWWDRPVQTMKFRYLGPCLTPAEVAAQLAAAKEEAADAKDTLAAWFDLAEKAEVAGTDVLRDSIDTWLRRASSGGMPSKHMAIVREVVDDAAHQYLWRALVPVLRGMASAQVAAARREGIEAAMAAVDACDGFCADMGTWHGVTRSEYVVPVDEAKDAIRALLPAPDAALAEDYQRWTEGKSDGC
jgi:hypothetical protein